MKIGDKIYCIPQIKLKKKRIFSIKEFPCRNLKDVNMQVKADFNQDAFKKNNCYIYIDRIDDIFYIGGIRTPQSTYVLDLFENGERRLFYDLDNSFVKTFCSLKEYRKIKLEKIK